MKLNTIRIVALIAVVTAMVSCRGQLGAQEDRGLPVGESAPSFTLKDQNGDDVSLESLLEEQNVAFVFYRSADW